MESATGFHLHPSIIGDSSAILSDGKRFVAHADEKLTAFLELEGAISVNTRPTWELGSA
jgi:hypothetical protein